VFVRKSFLHYNRVRVVVGYPLICPKELPGGCTTDDHVRLCPLLDLPLYLAVAEYAVLVRAEVFGARSFELTAVVQTTWILRSVSTTIVCEAECKFLGLDVSIPESLEVLINFLEIVVRTYLWTEVGVILVPGSMQIVSENVD
jgi:hypothetical protein